MTDKNTFYNMLKSNAESQPDAVAVVYDTMKVTYAKLFDDVTKKALHFQKLERGLQYSGRLHIDGSLICSERLLRERNLHLLISSFLMIRGLIFLRRRKLIIH